jgi:hypothetical protein
MKKFLFAFLLVPAITFAQSPATNANNVPKTPDIPQFQFNEDTWDFGNIPMGIPATHVFEYTSTGKNPVVVSQATASCGCTTPTWTKEPVPNGKKGSISVTYNAAREGSFVKTVTVLSNTGEPKYLTIKGTVLPKKDDNAPAQK